MAKKLFLSSGHYALLDDVDFERFKKWSWHVDYFPNSLKVKKVYRNTTIKNKSVKLILHREITGCVKGDGLLVDHRNGNALDCRRDNLRKATPQQNAQNRAASKNNILGHVGISLTKSDTKPYLAKLQTPDGVSLTRMFASLSAAISQRKEWELKYYKEYARGAA